MIHQETGCLEQQDQDALQKLEAVYRKVGLARKDEEFDPLRQNLLTEANALFNDLTYDCRFGLLQALFHQYRLLGGAVTAGEVAKAVRRGNLAKIVPKTRVHFDVHVCAMIDSFSSVEVRVQNRRLRKVAI